MVRQFGHGFRSRVGCRCRRFRSSRSPRRIRGFRGRHGGFRMSVCGCRENLTLDASSSETRQAT